MTDPHEQGAYRLRFDWGLPGAEALTSGREGEGGALVAVVDVLSFTTTVTVAADLGIEVWPYRWHDGSARTYAESLGATLAVSRNRARRPEVSLSPASLRRARGLRRLVLPSPNGSAIAHALSSASTTLAVSLRNSSRAGSWVAGQLARDPTRTLAVVAAGERWPEGSLRPAVEDLWGAGALLGSLVNLGFSASPEARAAVAAYRQAEPDLPTLLLDCASGRELVACGYSDDVAVAAELDASASVPLLVQGRFVPA